jgi:predicted MFS family arabinose efflux permease
LLFSEGSFARAIPFTFNSIIGGEFFSIICFVMPITQTTASARQKCQTLCYAIEGLSSFSTVIYTAYIFFYLHNRFGFSDKANLAAAAIIGLFYALAAWQAGRFAQKHGLFTSLKIGFGGMIVSLIIASLLQSAAGAILMAVTFSVFLCFTWPALEALVTECEAPDRIPHAVGIYNITWAVANASAFFIGGTIINLLGYSGIFFVPLAFLIVEFALLLKAEQLFKTLPAGHGHSGPVEMVSDPQRPTAERAKSFLHMAWLSNPFAYVAINTLIAVLPGLAEKFQLSPMQAGFACSLWGFARLAVFILLWKWTGWHYRFRWLATAFGLLVVSFGSVLLAPSILLLLVAQIFFGAAIGLIYYSSLYYSMDATDVKGEQGGIHEAVIGLGNCLGPAVGAASLQFASGHANSGAIAVSGLLLAGFGGLFGIWKRN